MWDKWDEKKKECEVISRVFGTVIEIPLVPTLELERKNKRMHLKENCAQELFYS